MIDSVISSEAIRSALREIGEEHMETKEFDIDLKSASKQGDNFIGIVHRVTYKRKDDEGQSHHQEKILGKNELAIILKVAPTNLARREAFGSRKFFLREMYVYNDLLSYFDEFQRAKSIDIPNEGFNEYVRCYRTIDVEPNESLLLEDLSAKSFSMIDRHTEVITADHVKLVLQAMGKFHATSFAIKDQKPDKFKEITSSISEEIFLYEGHEAFKKYFGILQKKTMDAITGTELMKSYDKLIEKSFYDTIVACVIGESAEPYAIVCHGDCWSNNTLFKYDENGKPIEVCLIDWQITRYASPVTDILYYIFGCVGTELRQSHYNIFLKTYHDSLSNHLKRSELSF